MTDSGVDSSSALRDRHELELAMLVEQFEEARRRDPLRVTVEAWCEKHAGFKDELMELLPGLLLMESVASEASEAAVKRAELEAIPDSIGEYRIKRQIGRGGMGIVYLAEQASLGREVALKVLPTNVDLDRGFLERFRREAKAAARLLHPNIVPVFGAGQADGRHFFAMRYIEGASLEETLRELRGSAGAGFACHGAAKIVAEIAGAVAHAHSKGILHRDIKPGNVLLDREGRSWVTDFGLCRIDDAGQLTSDGAILGTLRYMAPEQIEGIADERSDVYGVGLLLFELLAMRPAFDSAKRAKVVHDVLHTPVPRLRRLRRDVPRALETIVQKATTKLPQERYASAEALQRDLRAYLEDRPISARPPSAFYLARLFASRHRLATGVAVVAALLLGLLGALYVRDLRASRSLSERRAYVGDLAAAEAALREGATQRARFHLDQAPESLRAWEWEHLDARIDQSLGAVQLTEGSLTELAVHPSGTRVAVASSDGVSLLSLPSLEPFAQIRCGLTRTLAWDATGQHLFVGLDDGWLHHYGPSDGAEGGEFELLGSTQIPLERRREPKSMVQYGEDVIVGTRLGFVLRWTPLDGSLALVDVLGGDIVSVGRIGLTDSTNGAVDGARFWAASGAGEVVLYRGAQRERLYRLDNRQEEVIELSLDASLKSGVFCTRAGSVLAFEDEGREMVELQGGYEDCRALAVDGRHVAAVGRDKLVHVVDRERRSELRTLSGSPHPLNACAFAPSQEMILTAGEDGWLRSYDRTLAGGGLHLHGHLNDVNALSFSTDGRRLVTGGRDGVVIVWDVVRAVPLEVFTEPNSMVSVVGFSDFRGVETIFAGATDGSVFCWGAVGSRVDPGADSTGDGIASSSLRALKELQLGASIQDADLDDETGRIYFATSKGVTCLDPQSLEFVSLLESGKLIADGEFISAVSVYGSRGYAMNQAGVLWAFNPQTGETFTTFDTGFPTLGARLSFTGGEESPRGVFASAKREVVQFDALTGETEVLFSSRTADGGLGELVKEALWIEDGERVLVTTRNGLISVWDPKNAEHLLDLRGHEHWAMRIEQCEATGWIASLSSYGGVRLWNTTTSKEWAALVDEGEPFQSELDSRAAVASIERRGLMNRVAADIEETGQWTSSADRMLVGSMYRQNAADIEVAAMYALDWSSRYRSTDALALLESALARLPQDHLLRPLVEEKLGEFWDVKAWRDERRGKPLLGLNAVVPPSSKGSVVVVAVVCAPMVLVGSIGGFAPISRGVLRLLRR